MKATQEELDALNAMFDANDEDTINLGLAILCNRHMDDDFAIILLEKAATRLLAKDQKKMHQRFLDQLIGYVTYEHFDDGGDREDNRDGLFQGSDDSRPRVPDNPQ